MGVRLGYVFCGIPKSKLFEVRTCNFQKIADLMRKFLYFFGLPAFWRVSGIKQKKPTLFCCRLATPPSPPPHAWHRDNGSSAHPPSLHLSLSYLWFSGKDWLFWLANSYDKKKSLVIFPSFHVSCKQKHWRKYTYSFCYIFMDL